VAGARIPDGWRLEVAAFCFRKSCLDIPALRTLPQVEQITRHICIEGWSQIGRWSGVPLRGSLQRDWSRPSRALCELQMFRWVFASIDMASALHPQTISGA